MIINHNMSAIYTQRQLNINDGDLQKDIEKLSSGQRINRAGDDAAGLAVSEKMRAQVKGLYRASQNAQDGISFIQTTEGYLQNTQDILQRVRVLAVQSSNGIYTTEDRMQIQVEVSQLIDEIDRIASHAQFNGLSMLTGRFAFNTVDPQNTAASLWFHIGANMDQRERVYIGTMTARALNIKEQASNDILSLSTMEKANQAIGTLDVALKKVSKQRADLGAYQNRLEYAIKGLESAAENIQSAESRIRDTDMAHQMVEYSKNNILLQSANAMLAQANQRTQSVLQLLR
ncbi:MAG TPA: flagellin [Spirochaetia bacterium]|nr:MAG: flagellin [Spirochaetes bacterium GWB1_36_13]HCL56361.1 flagellin [Spirochaetia bacterium]